MLLRLKGVDKLRTYCSSWRKILVKILISHAKFTNHHHQDTPTLYKLVVQNHITTEMTKGAQVSDPHAQVHIRKDNLISRYFLSAHITNSICNK